MGCKRTPRPPGAKPGTWGPGGCSRVCPAPLRTQLLIPCRLETAFQTRGDPPLGRLLFPRTQGTATTPANTSGRSLLPARADRPWGPPPKADPPPHAGRRGAFWEAALHAGIGSSRRGLGRRGFSAPFGPHSPRVRAVLTPWPDPHRPNDKTPASLAEGEPRQEQFRAPSPRKEKCRRGDAARRARLARKPRPRELGPPSGAGGVRAAALTGRRTWRGIGGVGQPRTGSRLGPSRGGAPPGPRSALGRGLPMGARGAQDARACPGALPGPRLPRRGLLALVQFLHAAGPVPGGHHVAAAPGERLAGSWVKVFPAGLRARRPAARPARWPGSAGAGRAVARRGSACCAQE